MKYTACKQIIKYLDEGYCIVIPKYNIYEKKPSWNVIFRGTKEECKKEFSNYPDYIKASYTENRELRQNAIKVMLFYKSIGNKKQVEYYKTIYKL